MSLIVLLILSEDDGFNKSVHQIVSFGMLTDWWWCFVCFVFFYFLFIFIWFLIFFFLFFSFYFCVFPSLNPLRSDECEIQQLSSQILKNIHWYTERSISEISLGGLLILVVIRTIQYNMLKMRDKYLHTNCLAALANMSGQFRSLHPYVAQRLVSLFETLAKKHARLDQQLKQPVNGTPIVELTDSSMVLSDDMVGIES